MTNDKKTKPIGTTDLFGISGVSKSDRRIQLLGALDEASAALSLAKAFIQDEEDKQSLETCQSQLSSLMGFVARIGTNHELNDDQQFFAQELEELEGKLESLKEAVTLPRKFIFFGDNPQTGTLDMARTIIRRAEREATLILNEFGVKLDNGRQYLNRLSTLCYLLILKYRS